MNIAIGSDHAGFPLKKPILELLKNAGYEIIDFGSYNEDPVDFPDIARKVGAAVLNGEANRGIMVCGTGVGASIALNKIPGIRASVCHDLYTAHQCVEHDDVNVMCVGAQVVGHTLAVELVSVFLEAKFNVTDPEFARRVAKLGELERDFQVKQ